MKQSNTSAKPPIYFLFALSEDLVRTKKGPFSQQWTNGQRVPASYPWVFQSHPKNETHGGGSYTPDAALKTEQNWKGGGGGRGG